MEAVTQKHREHRMMCERAKMTSERHFLALFIQELQPVPIRARTVFV